MKIQIRKTGINGEGIGYLERKPVFIPGCFPGETVEARIIRTMPGYHVGQLEKTIHRSSDRVRSICPISDSCGGCAFMKLKYDRQLEYKQQLLEEALIKYAGIQPKCESIMASDLILEYRNRASTPLTMTDKGLQSCFYQPSSNHPVAFDDCPIHSETVEKVRKQVLKILNDSNSEVYSRKSGHGYRHLMVRAVDRECQVVLVTGNDEISQKIQDNIMAIPEVVSLWQGINTVKNSVNAIPTRLQLLQGEEAIGFTSAGLKLSLSPQSFYQLNHRQAVKMYETVCDMIPPDTAHIVEAYSGIGIMGMMLHDKAEKVTCVELVEKACEDGRKQCSDNGIDNVEYICGDAGEEIRKLLDKQKIDVLIVDPPRSGLDDDMVRLLKISGIERIIYVSCNPSTLAKNYKILESRYKMEKLVPLDMFPQTPLVEAVAQLVKKK